MKIFLDTEFTGLHKETSLISIGLVDENGEEFYGELTDYDKNQIDYWLQENVMANLWYESNKVDFINPPNYYRGDKEYIALKLKKWLAKYETVEWVSDVPHYDFVLLIDLLYGKAINIPYLTHGASIHDINQDIAKHYNISELEAFDLSREEILAKHNIEIDGLKHNAIYDAKVIKAIYGIVNRPIFTVGVEIKDIDEMRAIFDILKDDRVPKSVVDEYLTKIEEVVSKRI